MESSVRDEIEKLEQQIERLSEQRGHCRKVAFAAKTAIGLGGVMMAALLLGLLGSDVLWLLVAAILLLGGIVLSGSNARTADDLVERIADAERQRAELIGEIKLTLVPEMSKLLH
jgi:hypothetical protein